MQKFIMFVTLCFCLKMSNIIASFGPCTTTCPGRGGHCVTTHTSTSGATRLACVSNGPSIASGDSTYEATTNANNFISSSPDPSVTSTDPSVTSTDPSATAKGSTKFQTVCLTNQTFKSKIGKLKNGKIHIKRSGTYHVSIVAHHASPTASEFVDNRAELKHQLTINGVFVPSSTAQTVWSTKPSGNNRHMAHIHTRCTTFLKEGDEVSVKISGSTQAGVARTPFGTSLLVSIELATPASAKKR